MQTYTSVKFPDQTTPYQQLTRVGKFYPHAVLTVVKTPVKTGLGKTPKTRMSWAKLGKTNFLNSKNATYFHILFINL